MSDYISRQAAIDLWERYRPYIAVKASEYDTELKKLPTADVVEVVRCKDCKYYEIYQLKSDYTDDKRYKPSVCVNGKYAVHRNPNWFCADAERRTDEP